MARPVHLIQFFLICMIFAVTGCRQDPFQVDISGIDARVQVERFDRDLFEMDLDTLELAIGTFYNNYADFFDIFNVIAYYIFGFIN